MISHDHYVSVFENNLFAAVSKDCEKEKIFNFYKNYNRMFLKVFHCNE